MATTSKKVRSTQLFPLWDPASNHVAAAAVTTQPNLDKVDNQNSPYILLSGFRGCVDLIFFGNGAAGNTLNYRVFGIHKVTNKVPPQLFPDSGASEPMFLQREMFSGIATLGARVGTAGEFLDASQRMAKSVTIVKNAYLTHLESVYGITAAAHSPGGASDVATVSVADVGDLHSLFIDIYTGGTATNGNCLVNLSN